VTEQHFLHVALSYDLREGKHSFQSLDDATLRHQPCGPACNLDKTMRSWQAIPESVRQLAYTWVEDNFDIKVWDLHAVVIVKSSQRLRKFLQRLVLGTSAPQSTDGILIVIKSSEAFDRSGNLSASVSTISSVSSPPSRAVTKDDVEKLKAELNVITADLKSLRSTHSVVTADAHVAPIKFKDAVGRTFTFPWHTCKTWKCVQSLINEAFLHVDILGQHVHQGHYDLVDPDGSIILPQLWESTIRPGLEISMHMWPIETSEKHSKKKAAEPDDQGQSTFLLFDNPFDPQTAPIVDVGPPPGIATNSDLDRLAFDYSHPLPKAKMVTPGKRMGKKNKIGERSSARTAEIPAAMPPADLPDLTSTVAKVLLDQRVKDIDGESSKQKKTKNFMEEITAEDRNSLPEDSDAEDAVLDDEALKNKMLLKYAGGVADLGIGEPLVSCD
jgi:hypothetical protein